MSSYSILTYASPLQYPDEECVRDTGALEATRGTQRKVEEWAARDHIVGVLEEHRGAIQVESHPSVGTRMRVLLPMTSRPIVQVAHRDAAASDLAETTTVLLVDDEATVRDMTSRMLAARGFSVLVAHDGPSALALFESRHEEVSVVLLDMVMPGMNGHEVLAALRGLDPDVRVVMTSGYSETHVMDGLDLVVSSFIQKPYRPRDLERVLSNAIRDNGVEARPGAPDSERSAQLRGSDGRV